MQQMNKAKIILLMGVAIASFAFFFSRPIMVQPLEYHAFTDQRSFLGVPNAMDVLSNFGFLIVGMLGLAELSKQTMMTTRKSWIALFSCVLLVAPGSAYYHWWPDNQSLIWDRLPMSMGFMALYIVLLSEHISLRLQKFLPFALFIGVLSVLTWVITTDLRFYFWVQFSSFLTIPIVLALFPSRFNKKIGYIIALIFYALAKFAEVKDAGFYQATGHLMSGHTLKHLLSALGILTLWWMVKTRQDLSQTAAGWRIADTSPLLEKPR